MNEFIQQFHFLRPWWFLALVPALLAALALWHSQRQDQQLSRVFNPAFLPFLLDKTQLEQKKWPLLGLFVLWFAATFAVAGPAWKKISQPVERNTEALVIAWDLSPSMLAQDLTPSRLVRSRLKLIDLLTNRSDGQAALVAYAGDAHTVTPLTEDYQTIINLLPALSPTTLPSTGSNAEMALKQAIELLKDAGVSRGNILFLTDGIAPGAFDTMAKTLRQTPHTLTVWGVGSAEGAPIPLPQGGFAKDELGETVIAGLNEDELQQFTSRLGANYVPLLPTDNDIETLERLLTPLAAETERSDRTFDQWFEHGQIFAFLLLPFVAWFFRRGWVFSFTLLLGVSAVVPQQAQASQWERLWLNQDQRAEKRLKQGETDAAREFTTAERRGAALFETEAFAEAASEFAEAEGAEQAYNRGTALTHAGQYEEAIAAFDRALELNSDFEAAKDNRAIAEQLAQLQQQNEQQQGEQNQDGDQNQQGDQNQGDDNSQQGSSDENQQGESGEGEQQAANDSNADPADAQSNDSAQQPGEEPAEEEANPYADAEPEQEQQNAQEQQEQTAAQEQAQDEQADADQQQAGVAMQEGQTEQEQQLEQWLRKVPDDPSGLMRNKFRYEHMQRQRQLNAPAPYSDNQAQQRW